MKATVGSSGVGRGSGIASASPPGSSANSLPTSSAGILEWVPSQKGGLAVCLHWQSQASPSSSATKLLGSNPLPACEPSQKGWLADFPQVQK